MGKRIFKKTLSLFVISLALFAFAACNKEDVKPDAPSLEIDRELIEDVSKDGAEIELNITVNRGWKITTIPENVNWLLSSKNEGYGNETIIFTLAPNSGVGREITVRIATSTVYKDVRITQTGAIVSETLYADNFGTTATQTGTAWPSIAEYTGWNKSGTGSSNVTYTSEGGAVSVRSNSTSSGYAGASGSANIMMAAAGASFIVKDINTKGMATMNLSFGSNEAATVLKLYYSIDGTNWTEVNYDKNAEGWGLAQASFSIPASNTLHLKFTAAATQYGTRIDDIKLVGTEGGGVTPPPVGNNLTVSLSNLSFAATGENKTFNVTSNTSWTVTSSQTWCTVNPGSGSNNGTVTVTTSANTGNSRTATITVKTTDNSVTRTVTVVQDAASSSTVLYTDNFGTTATQTGTAWPSIAEYTGWNKSGSGSSNVTYTSEGGAVSVRSNSTSSGYTGASGSVNVMMAAAGASFIVKDINSMGMTSINLSFGLNETNTILKLYYSTDGTNWTEVSYDKTTSGWGLVETSFSIPASSSALHLKFTASTTQYGTRVDDIKVTGEGGTTPPPTGNELTVSTSGLSFAASGENKTFNVTSNTSWTATSSGAWCTVNPGSGSNNGTVTVTSSANTGSSSRTATITVKTTDNSVTRTITVTQEAAGGSSTVLYADDFGTTATQTGTAWPSIADYIGWNKSGTGSSNVTYVSEGGTVSVRSNSTSSGYAGASGSVNVMMAATGASFIVKDINPMGMTSISLSFGSNETNTILKLYYSTNGTSWTEVNYDKTASGWGLVETSFSIPASSSALHLKFTASATQYATRVDDVKVIGE